MDDTVAFGSRTFFAMFALLSLARGADFLSTWIATPNLVLEGNPLARLLGWKWGAAVNLGLCAAFAAWPFGAIFVSTTSLLVAARNFQSAWLMRSLGEEAYRQWYVERLLQTNIALYLFCLAGQTLLTAVIGGALVVFYNGMLIPLAIGMGVLGYAVAVTFFTLLSVWRIRRSAG